MWRLLLIGSIAPFLIACLASNLIGAAAHNKKLELNKTVSSLLNHLLQVMGEDDIEVVYVKRPLWTFTPDEILRIPAKLENSCKASDVAHAFTLLGFVLLFRKQPAPIQWRLKMVRLGNVLPLFALLIGVFTFLLAKIPLAAALAALFGSLSLCSVFLWLSISVEKEAAQLMINRVEALRILPRLSEEEKLVAAIKATPWLSLIPGAILKFIR